jgi:hypothetical protein
MRLLSNEIELAQSRLKGRSYLSELTLLPNYRVLQVGLEAAGK